MNSMLAILRLEKRVSISKSVLHLIIFLVLFIPCSDSKVFASDAAVSSSIILNPVPGGVSNARRGVTYTVEFSTLADRSIVQPNNNGEIANGNLGVNISGAANSIITVEMRLPEYLTDINNDYMSIVFPASGPLSGIRIESGGYFNPHTISNFNLGAGGTCKLRLGYTFTFPSNAPHTEWSYTGTIRCFVTSTNLLKSSVTTTDSVDILITLNQNYTPLVVAPVSGNVKNLVRGVEYQVIYDAYAGASGIKPNYNLEEVAGNLGINISGETTSNVSVEMQLPSTLSNNQGDTISISFPTTGPGSGVRNETGGFFNPYIKNSFNLGGGGTCNLRLGYRFRMGTFYDLDSTGYSGVIHCIVSYTTIGKTNHTIQEYTTIYLTVHSNNSRLQIHNNNSSTALTTKSDDYVITYNVYTNTGFISPSLNGELVLSNLGFDISGELTQNVQVTLTLPSSLTGQGITPLGISFPESGTRSGVRVETGGFFNPNVVNTFNLGGLGRLGLRLGYVIHVPENVSVGTYRGAVTCKAKLVGLHKGTNITSEVISTAFLEVDVRPATFSPVQQTMLNGNISQLRKGTTYSISPSLFSGVTTITPISGSEHIDSTYGVTFEGYSGSTIAVDFNLPSYLYYPSDDSYHQVYKIPISFPSLGSNSGLCVETGLNFDPHKKQIFTIGSTGKITLRLGCIIVVPNNVSMGIYTGAIIPMVYRYGFSKDEETMPSGTRSAIELRVGVGVTSVPSRVLNVPFTIDQNYPNPANPGTYISFTLRSDQYVNLTIYNMLGEEITTLVSEHLFTGFHKYHWDASMFPTGVYFYMLQAGNYSSTKKLMVIK